MFRDLSVLYRETTCVSCLEPFTVRKDIPDPIQCSECEGARPMARKKKDFSEAVAASDEASSNREPMIIGRKKEKLPVRIDDAACALKGQELAKVVTERLALKEANRAKNADFREKRSHLDEREKELSKSIEQHTELRLVDCVERLLPTNEVELVRSDTGEVVSTRPAEAKDLQQDRTTGANPKPINGQPHADA